VGQANAWYYTSLQERSWKEDVFAGGA
jgi:hypothetical protein